VTVDFREGEVLGAPVVPARAQEGSGLAEVGERLLEAQSEAVLASSRLIVGHDIRRLPGSLRPRQRLPIDPHSRVVLIGQEPEHGAERGWRERELDVVPPRTPDVPVEDVAVREVRHEVAAHVQGPARIHQTEDRPIAVAARVGGIVPGRVVEQPPVAKLAAGGVGVAVLVEVIRRSELAELQLEPSPGLETGELVHGARYGVGAGRERDRVTEEGARDIGALSQIDAPLTDHVSVRDPREADRAADRSPACHLDIEVRLQPPRQT
jgi:hypothetical protein